MSAPKLWWSPNQEHAQKYDQKYAKNMIRNLLGIVLLLLCVPTVTQNNDQKHAQKYCFLILRMMIRNMFRNVIRNMHWQSKPTLRMMIIDDECAGGDTCRTATAPPRINYLYAICKKGRARLRIIIWMPYLTGVIILPGKPNPDFPRIRKGFLSDRDTYMGALVQHMFGFSGSIA